MSTMAATEVRTGGMTKDERFVILASSLGSDGSGIEAVWVPAGGSRTPVTQDVMGDMEPFLQENMKCMLSMFNGVCVAISLPAKVTLEITETEPTMKGQTASSSFKPAILSNGVRTLVPGYITVGTKVVIMTEDSSFVERAK